MREILFRGKDKFDGEWYAGSLSHDTKYGNCFIEVSVHQGITKEVIPETVGQYTGMTDKNGTKIFENGYMIIDNKTYKVIFDNAEYILTNIFNCDIITLKNNSIKGVFVDEI